MLGSMWLFGWWLSRKERRSESQDQRPWETLTPEERQRRLRQVAARRAQAQEEPGQWA